MPVPIIAGAEGEGDPPKDPPQDPPKDPPKEDDADDGGTSGEWDRDRARVTIERLRAREREQAAELKAGRDAQQRLKELEDRDLNERQRLERDRDEARARAERLESENRETRLRIEVERAARKLGAVDDEAVVALVDRGQLEVDADGRPTNAERVVKELLEKRPFLKGDPKQREPVPGGSKGGGNGSGGTKADVIQKTREELKQTGKYAL
jgi:hypothetical protein